MASDSERIKLPGFGRPLNHFPYENEWGLVGPFPSVLLDTWQAATLTIRELYMLWFVEKITNKPDWHVKVFNDEIVSKWKHELASVDWSSAVGYQHGPYSDAMFAYSLAELREKARLYEKTGIVPVFDVSAAVLKSDTAIPRELKDELRAAVARLEDVPDHQKDWHPRSDGKVLDLVHPSLWPLVYGRTRILPDRRLTLENCLDACGIGEVIPRPGSDGSRRYFPGAWSTRFQWLPCDVDLDEATGRAKIVSYINNLHPTRHRDLYTIIEKVIDKTLPLWDLVHRWPREFDKDKRIQCHDVSRTCTIPDFCQDEEQDRGGCEPYHRPLEEGEAPRPVLDDYSDLEDDHPLKAKDNAWFDATHPVPQPEPEPYDPADGGRPPGGEGPTAEDVHKEGEGPSFFSGLRRLQVIVKLANIHLTPENPTYDGGSWHIEGQLNEHICATALYYYDSDNITPSHLAFRTPGDREGLSGELGYEQDNFRPITMAFAIDDPNGSTLQNLGRVLTREDRLLVFPNVYQHRVAPFSLADDTRPGHRKILALFLVDPALPVIGTANVPPQQRHWWLEGHDDGGKEAEEADGGDRGGWRAKLPPEVQQIVLEQMEWPIGWEEAKATRLELIYERTRLEEEQNVPDAEWNFCEH
ncbi:hypothetical protein SODALDRAFT_333036 [Sodiomyces alkalinus F11]|uniref:Uncharacterized protein n=1 Tax=Sodiomyces alkalinus (strain CBS 110278 / VKM F-3762 / F11) TaxID=1314773 RepID=A0A3N2PVD0_SODAK|nr:hypothetical protein SODALDRAFT_333036 [Sodiomyces alkalinus F11]ROT38455.1 hypothetical protein SODALDRAFT_333036 [Sodiomyces alkalinus F11]